MPEKNTLNVLFKNGVRMNILIDERGCIFGGRVGNPSMPYMNLTPQATINLLANESGYSAGDPKVGNPNISAGSLIYHYTDGRSTRARTLGDKTSVVVYNLLDIQKDPPCNKPVPTNPSNPTTPKPSGYNILTWKPSQQKEASSSSNGKASLISHNQMKHPSTYIYINPPRTK